MKQRFGLDTGFGKRRTQKAESNQRDLKHNPDQGNDHGIESKLIPCPGYPPCEKSQERCAGSELQQHRDWSFKQTTSECYASISKSKQKSETEGFCRGCPDDPIQQRDKRNA